jgi:hypothetical protein
MPRDHRDRGTLCENNGSASPRVEGGVERVGGSGCKGEVIGWMGVLACGKGVKGVERQRGGYRVVRNHTLTQLGREGSNSKIKRY